MDTRIPKICALALRKPCSVGETAAALGTTVASAAMVIGKLVAAGIVAREGEMVSVVDVPRAQGIASGEVAFQARKYKARAKGNGAANGHASVALIEPPSDAVVCFAKDEDGCLNIARRDGEGSVMCVSAAELKRLLAFMLVNFKEVLA